MALQFAYTDGSGTTHPNAYLVYRHLRLQTDPNAGELEISIYHDATAYTQGRSPVDPPKVALLSATEVAVVAAQYASVPYVLLQQRPEYHGGVIVE